MFGMMVLGVLAFGVAGYILVLILSSIREGKENKRIEEANYCCAPACEWLGGRCPEIKSCQVRDANKLSDSIIANYRLEHDIPLRTKQQEAEETMERR